MFVEKDPPHFTLVFIPTLFPFFVSLPVRLCLQGQQSRVSRRGERFKAEVSISAFRDRAQVLKGSGLSKLA